jgi:MFS family permease
VLASTLVTALYQTMTQVKAVSATYLISGGILLLTAIYALTVRDVPFEQKKQINAGKLKFRRLLSNYYFASLLVFNFALNVFINPPFVFLPYILTESGIDSAKVGLIVGWEALLELPMLFLMNKLRKRLPLHVLLIMSSVLFAVTAAGQSMSHSMTMLMLCGTLFGFANSLNFSCGYHYIYCIAPIELRATAQTFYSIAGSLGIIAGNLAAGSLIEKMGTRPVYSLFAILTLAVAGAYTLSFIFGSRVLKKNVPNIVPDI